jgi:hypothetical protein
MNTELKVGDWVTSYHQGIWQIYRILECKVMDPYSKLAVSKTTIFSKRFVSPSFKRSFSQECCDPSFAEKLDRKTQSKLKAFIKQNSALFKLFNEYVPKPVDSVYNARIGIPERKNVEEIEALFSRERVFNELEIDPYLRSLGFDTEELPSWTAQFLSKDHVCQGGYLVYRFQRILEF